MPARTTLALVAALVFAASVTAAHAAKKTVCTITVNSPDERDIFRRWLPADDFDFVELVERGRSDWLASACRAGVQCDALIISGHFDGGTEFYSDRLGAREYLPVAEMERVSCSESCPGLFAQLQEVYLFGCNTLDPAALRSASAEVTRSLLRAGYSADDADALARALTERHGESNRDHMRHIFKDVPVIYGFSAKAPLGAHAGPILERWFQSGAAADVASGRPSAKLLALFGPASMTMTAGSTRADADATYRDEVCRFADDRLTPAQKFDFVHRLLQRDMAEVRMFFERIELYAASLTEPDRQTPSVAKVLDEIARDDAARARYLDFARDADQSAVRTRMMALARTFGWLSADDQRAEFLRMIRDRMAANAVSVAEIDLVCSARREPVSGDAALWLEIAAVPGDSVANAAVLACLGSAAGHARVMRALTSASEVDVEIAEVYLRHRPIGDVAELRTAALGIARMGNTDAQARALDALARLSVSDRESLDALTRVYTRAKSVRVQRAVAGILIRADTQAIGKPQLVRALREHRLKSPEGEDVIDILIRRLQAS
jgi:hypothetical protein